MTTTPTASPSDFADWLSPMLVKELRQGLKTKVFVGIFILVQAVLVLLLGFQLLAQADESTRDTTQFLDVILYMALGVALLVLMPSRGLNVIAEEVKGNTLSLVQLTDLSATRIVWGKWFAIVCQMLLLVTSVLPYALLRYFFGNVEIVENAMLILTMVTGSMTLTAAALLLSTLPAGTRVLLVLAGIPGFFVLAGASAAIFTFGNVATRMALGSTTGWLFILGIFIALLSTALHCLYLLTLATANIASESTNHAARKRLIALFVVLISIILTVGGQKELGIAWMLGSSLIWGWSLIDALIESTCTIQSLYAPWARRGLLGRLAGSVLYPGWATGLVFTFIMTGLGTWLFAMNVTHWSHFRAIELLHGWALGYLALVAPCVVFVRFPGLKQRGWRYVFIQLFMLMCWSLALLTEKILLTDKDGTKTLQALTPTSAFLAMMGETGQDHPIGGPLWTLSLPIGGAILLYLVWKAAREFKFMRWMERGGKKV